MRLSNGVSSENGEGLPEVAQKFIDQVIDLHTAYLAIINCDLTGPWGGREYVVKFGRPSINLYRDEPVTAYVVDKSGKTITYDYVLSERRRLQFMFGVRCYWIDWHRYESTDCGEWRIRVSEEVTIKGGGVWYRGSQAIPAFGTAIVKDEKCDKQWGIVQMDHAREAFTWLFRKW